MLAGDRNPASPDACLLHWEKALLYRDEEWQTLQPSERADVEMCQRSLAVHCRYPLTLVNDFSCMTS
jgi:hypothetical protein